MGKLVKRILSVVPFLAYAHYVIWIFPTIDAEGFWASVAPLGFVFVAYMVIGAIYWSILNALGLIDEEWLLGWVSIPFAALEKPFMRKRPPTDGEWEAIEEWEDVEDYPEYLASEEWAEKRGYMIRRADGRCQVCNGSGPLEVHHRTYERIGREVPQDLIVLCSDCHGTFHASRALAR